MKNIKIVVVLLSLFAFYNSSHAEDYIQLVKDNVNIRFSPKSTSTIVAIGMKNDIFKLTKIDGEWSVIFICSGEYRYIHSSLVKKILSIPPLTSSVEIKKKAFNELAKVQDKALAQAMAKYPNDIYKEIDYSRMLDDKYGLTVLRKYSIASPWYTKLIAEGAKKRWSIN